MSERIILVDLNSGKYTQTQKGYELYNLEQNQDGKYYGFVPNADNVDIKKLDPKAKGFVDGVLVVYVQAISAKNRNRKIIAYCKNAKIFAKPQSGEAKNRFFIDYDGTKKCATYCIESDNLKDLRMYTTFEIDLKQYSTQMFRRQRSYLEKYPELKSKILAFIAEIEHNEATQEKYQQQIQRIKGATKEESEKHGDTPDQIISAPSVQCVKRDPSIAKRVLAINNYHCAIDSNHSTFQTRSGVAYMEAHHLIPCTVSNSQKFQEKSKLDREENIVCICPNCHRAIHYGNGETQKKYLKILYNEQKDKLDSVGLKLSFEELLNLYKTTL